jgi:hypothetical protein
MQHIFVASGSEQKGPYSEAEIRAKITSGAITGDTLVWWDGLPEWTAVAKTPLAPSPASPAPAPSAAAAPSAKPEPSIAPEPSVTPAANPTPAPTATPAPAPSAVPAPTPSVAPAPAPTVTPVARVEAAPSVEPAPEPTIAPAPITSAPAPLVPAAIPASVGESKTSTLALISLITALVGFFCGLVSVAAVVTGHLARAEIKKNPQLTGGGMALAGLIIGYVWIAVSVIGILAYLTLLGLAIHQGMAQDQGNLLPNTAPATPGN